MNNSNPLRGNGRPVTCAVTTETSSTAAPPAPCGSPSAICPPSPTPLAASTSSPTASSTSPPPTNRFSPPRTGSKRRWDAATRTRSQPTRPESDSTDLQEERGGEVVWTQREVTQLPGERREARERKRTSLLRRWRGVRRREVVKSSVRKNGGN